MGYIWKLPRHGLYHSSLCRYFNKCLYWFTVQKYKEIPYIVLLCLMIYIILRKIKSDCLGKGSHLNGTKTLYLILPITCKGGYVPFLILRAVLLYNLDISL